MSEAKSNHPIHHGASLSIGTARGRVLIIRGSYLTCLQDGASKGDKFVFVAAHGDPDLTVLCPHAAAFITEVGGATSHLANTCREYGIPYLRLDKAKTILVPDTNVVVSVQPGSATVSVEA